MTHEKSPRSIARPLYRRKTIKKPIIKLNPGESLLGSLARSHFEAEARLAWSTIKVGTCYLRWDRDAGTGSDDKRHPWVVLWKLDRFGILLMLMVSLTSRKACTYDEDEFAFPPKGLNGFVDPHVESVPRFDLAQVTRVSALMREAPQRLGCLQPDIVDSISRKFLDSPLSPSEVRTHDIVDAMRAGLSPP